MNILNIDTCAGVDTVPLALTDITANLTPTPDSASITGASGFNETAVKIT